MHENGKTTETQSHSHAPDARTKNKAEILNTLKTKAKTERASARELVTEACGNADDPTVAALPRIADLRRTAARIQNRDNVNVNPKTLNELLFDDNAVTTSRNKRFLLYDSAVDSDYPRSDKRLVIFGTR